MTAASNSESRKRLAEQPDAVEVVARAIGYESDIALSVRDVDGFQVDLGESAVALLARKSVAALRENGFAL